MNQEQTHGGTLGGVEELYKEVILDHFKSPKNKGSLTGCNLRSEGQNPLCGDEVILTGQVEQNHLKDIRFNGHGCAISQASSSMMTDLVKNKSWDEIKQMASLIKKMFGVEERAFAQGPWDELGDAVALEGVKKFPVRIKCALLCWNTLLQALEEHFKKGSIHG